MYDYASILFSGKCNARCSTCVGKLPEFADVSKNLNSRNLRGLDRFIEKSRDEGIRYISLSGVNVDPQQYKFEADLIKKLRAELPDAILSLHTNGRKALPKLDEFNSYDRATLSFASYNPDSYRAVMGVKLIDIEEVVRNSAIPIKLSMLLTEHNQEEFREYIRKTKELGIDRITIRKLVDREKEFDILTEETPIKYIFGNPVYKINDVEVTVWDYTKSTVKGLYLFPDGSLRDSFRNQK